MPSGNLVGCYNCTQMGQWPFVGIMLQDGRATLLPFAAQLDVAAPPEGLSYLLAFDVC